MRCVFAVLMGLAALPAAAEEIRLATPLEGATLHQGAVAMSVYWTGRGEAAEIVATYVAGADGPHRLTMAMAEGEETRFSLPGLRHVRYDFSRSVDGVTVRAEPADADVDLASMR